MHVAFVKIQKVKPVIFYNRKLAYRKKIAKLNYDYLGL
jgi:hypothetical protein